MMSSNSLLTLSISPNLLDSIRQTRWFQNKDSKHLVQEIKFIDSLEFFDKAFALIELNCLAGKFLYVLMLQVVDGSFSLTKSYSSVDNSELQVFLKLQELLKTNGNRLSTRNGEIELRVYSANSQLNMDNSKIDVKSSEQDSTNTTFILNTKSLLKIYRKVEIGLHPEDQILCLLSSLQPKDRLSALPLSKLIWRLNESTLQDLNRSIAKNKENDFGEIVFGLEQELLDNTGTCWFLFEKRLKELNVLIESTLGMISMENELLISEEFAMNDSEKLLSADQLSNALINSFSLSTAALSLIETLEQCFEAIGVSLAAMHNQVFELSGSSPFEIADYSDSDWEDNIAEIIKLYNFQKNNSADLTFISLDSVRLYIDSLKQDRKGSLGIKFKIHGDFHLGQILRTRNGYRIIDFEGQPISSLEERWQLKSPLKDLAGAIRSIQYAKALNARKQNTEKRNFAKDKPNDFWDKIFLNFESRLIEGYKYKTEFPLPEPITPLLNLEILLKTFQELDYELKTRPEMAWICLQALKEQLD